MDRDELKKMLGMAAETIAESIVQRVPTLKAVHLMIMDDVGGVGVLCGDPSEGAVLAEMLKKSADDLATQCAELEDDN